MNSAVFREAVSPADFEQIHALNHRVFAEEVAQHPHQLSRLLVDRLEDQSRYIVAVCDEQVVGMVSANAGPSFSVARRIVDSDVIARLRKPLEIRLLAIEGRLRSGMLFGGLLWQVYALAIAEGYSHLLISGIAERADMYRKMGFLELGPAVAEGSASFIPMVMDLEDGASRTSQRAAPYRRRWHNAPNSKPRLALRGGPISLMPGPVSIHPRTVQCYHQPAISHRSEGFVDCFEKVREQLRSLAGGMDVALFAGAGTMANDAVAAGLRAIFHHAEGLIVSNGEFGERLTRQAASAGLRFRHLCFPWGDAWPAEAVAAAMRRRPAWVWAVHLETSTGVVNDAETLLQLASEHGVAVALDCVSSLGALPLPEANDSLLFAGSVSGKSLGSFAGLAFVCLGSRCKELLADKTFSPSFDLLRMARERGPLSTVASSVLFALAQALDDRYATPAAAVARFKEYASLGRHVRCQLRSLGMEPLAPDQVAAPNITTFALPYASFAERCLAAGFDIAHESPYLRSRGWGQIATMGDVTSASTSPLFQALRSLSLN